MCASKSRHINRKTLSRLNVAVLSVLTQGRKFECIAFLKQQERRGGRGSVSSHLSRLRSCSLFFSHFSKSSAVRHANFRRVLFGTQSHSAQQQETSFAGEKLQERERENPDAVITGKAKRFAGNRSPVGFTSHSHFWRESESVREN